MGWYTTLQIKNHEWSWRKDLPPEALLIFYGSHKIINKDGTNPTIGIQASVAQAIKNLDNLGLTLDYFITIYSSYRHYLINFPLGFLNGLLIANQIATKENKVKDGRFTPSSIKKLIEQVKKGSPKDEIYSTIELLRNNISLESNLLGDESLIPALHHLKSLEIILDINIFNASLFGNFLSFAHENLKEIALLFEIRLVLEKENKNTKVWLDLADFYNETGELNVIETSVQTLALKAKTYSQTFDAILGGKDIINREFIRSNLISKWVELKNNTTNIYNKGSELEDFIAHLFNKSIGFEVIKKNLLVETQELDIIIKNKSTNDFIKSLNSPFILIECKNWESPVGVPEARVFESKIRDSGSKVKLGIFIAINNVTWPFKEHINRIIRDNIILVVITGKDIEDFLYSEELDINNWLEVLLSSQFILT